MSVTSSTDPIQTVVDILDATDAGDWPNAGSKPTYIERVEESPRNTKENRTSADAVYVWMPTEGSQDQFSAGVESYLDAAVVQVDAWSASSNSDPAGQAHALVEDVRSYFASNYWTDTAGKSNWHRIEPQASGNTTAHMNPRKADQGIATQQLRLERNVST